MFTIMVLMALVTTLIATPALALISPIYHRGMTREEFEVRQASEAELESAPTSVLLGEHEPAGGSAAPPGGPDRSTAERMPEAG
jgi:hypothetical protein